MIHKARTTKALVLPGGMMDRYAIIPLQCNCGSSYEAPVRARAGKTRSGLNIVKCLDCGANLHIPGELAQPLVRKN